MARINLSRLSEILEKQNSAVFHVGIDVHKKSYHVALFGDNGESCAFVCSAAPEEVCGGPQKLDHVISSELTPAERS